MFEFAEDLKRDGVVTLSKLPPDDLGGDSTRRSGGKVPADRRLTAPDDRPAPDWAKLLAPTGTETRLGQALRQLIQEERGTPVSGIIVLSDGGQNAGISPEAAVELAGSENPHLHRRTGLRPPADQRGRQRPGRAGPRLSRRPLHGDRLPSGAGDGGKGGHGADSVAAGRQRGGTSACRTATDADGTRRADTTGDVLDSRQVTLGGDGEVLPVKFELTPDAPGRRTLTFRVLAPEGDRNPADNSREADIEIVDRKNHVLLLADGPMREYQFLRNLLFRDRYTTLDVLLQSGKPGMSQEAKKTLDDFPTTREEMFEYDCVVALGPELAGARRRASGSAGEMGGEQGGGLIVVAGPVNACRGAGGWVQDPAMSTIRNLYPVEFPGRLAATENNMYSTREPWPLSFTREGLDADFLWLADAATASRQAWGQFPGVYSYCPVRGPKAGATVYARFSDPRVAQGDQQPVYFAGQFYGSGSVFYMGSGEMWRLRAVDDAYFEQFYTKLIRHVSQGRLLRGSSRGVLLVGQDRYMLGNSVEVRAQLTNARLEPLDVRSVNLQVFQPDGTAQTIALRADRSRAGAYTGQFPALLEGTYRLELPVPESQNERLGRRIQVKAPDLERENHRRNDALLSAIASGTNGKYYVGMSSALATSGPSPLLEQLRDRPAPSILPVAPNPQQEENWLRWIMIALSSLLCLEWLIRRLMKLA